MSKCGLQFSIGSGRRIRPRHTIKADSQRGAANGPPLSLLYGSIVLVPAPQSTSMHLVSE